MFHTQKKIICMICLTLVTSAIFGEVDGELSERHAERLREFIDMLERICKRTGREDTIRETLDYLMTTDEPCKRFIPEKIPSVGEKVAHVIMGLREMDHNLIEEIQELINMFGICETKFLNRIEQCFIGKKKKNFDLIKRAVEKATEFLADNINLFISEKGPECFANMETGLGLAECQLTLLKQQMDEQRFKSLEEYIENDFSFTLEVCRSNYQYRDCMVGVLKRCTNSKPATLLEMFFNTILDLTDCKEIDPDYRRYVKTSDYKIINKTDNDALKSININPNYPRHAEEL